MNAITTTCIFSTYCIIRGFTEHWLRRAPVDRAPNVSPVNENIELNIRSIKNDNIKQLLDEDAEILQIKADILGGIFWGKTNQCIIEHGIVAYKRLDMNFSDAYLQKSLRQMILQEAQNSKIGTQMAKYKQANSTIRPHVRNVSESHDQTQRLLTTVSNIWFSKQKTDRTWVTFVQGTNFFRCYAL